MQHDGTSRRETPMPLDSALLLAFTLVIAALVGTIIVIEVQTRRMIQERQRSMRRAALDLLLREKER